MINSFFIYYIYSHYLKINTPVAKRIKATIPIAANIKKQPAQPHPEHPSLFAIFLNFIDEFRL